MLKVNEKFLRESLSELKQCDKEFYNHFEQINRTQHVLSENLALEAQLTELNRILRKAEVIQCKIKSMTRVLDYAVFEYGQCEKSIVSQYSQSLLFNKNSSRFDKVVFNVPFSSYIEWRKGVHNGSEF